MELSQAPAKAISKQSDPPVIAKANKFEFLVIGIICEARDTAKDVVGGTPKQFDSVRPIIDPPKNFFIETPKSSRVLFEDKYELSAKPKKTR